MVENLSIRGLTRSPRVLARNNKQSQLEEIIDLVESIPDFRGRNWFILQDVVLQGRVARPRAVSLPCPLTAR